MIPDWTGHLFSQLVKSKGRLVFLSLDKYLQQKFYEFTQQLQSSAMKILGLEANSKLIQIEYRLNKYSYLSKRALPGSADALVYLKLRDAQRMPTKQKYFNFYHWYILMSQFALKEIQHWAKEENSPEDDREIQDCLLLIGNFSEQKKIKHVDGSVDYIMNIFVKDPVDNNITSIKNKLLTMKADLLGGEELNISFRSYSQRVHQYAQESNQLRIMFKLTPKGCERLKDLVTKWPEVQNIQIKKQMKEKRN